MHPKTGTHERKRTMANREISKEKCGRLIQARDQEEVRVLLGPETTQEEIDRVWREIEAHRPADRLEDVDDEPEAVSGGADRDWEKDGCSASVEEGSWCGSYDKCNFWDVTCDNFDPCPKAGRHIGNSARGHSIQTYNWLTSANARIAANPKPCMSAE